MARAVRCCSLLLFVGIARSRSALNAEEKLFRKLFDESGYDKRARPVKDADQPVIVSFRLDYNQLYEINEKAQTVSILTTIYESWDEARWFWNTTDFSNLSSIAVDDVLLWRPDTTLYNGVEMYRPSVEDSAKAIVTMPPRHNFSRIKYFYNGRHTIGCIFNMRFFPFDTQNCTFTFGSWCQDGSMLRYSLETDHVTTEYHQPSDTWTLVSFQMMAQESKFDCCQYPFVTVQAHYVIKRKSLYYAFNLILPTLVINILSSYALFASEGSPENRHDKLQIGLTTLLSYCILLLSVSDQLPKGSTSVPLLGIFYIVIMLQNALELVVSVYLSFPHRRQRFILAYTRLISDRSWRFRKITSAKSAEANWEAGKNAIEVVSKEKEATSMDADHPEFVCLTLGIISTAVITGIVFAVGCTV